MRNMTTALMLLLIAAATKLPQVVTSRSSVDATVTPKAKAGKDGKDPADGSAATKKENQKPFPAKEIDSAEMIYIATLPDPKLTRLGLHFDRFVDSIQRAAELRGYLFESQWLPWSLEQFEYKEPGVLMFRRGKQHMAILLVGESPAAGVSEAQLCRAMTLARQHPEGILGPIFSGGFHSLGEILRGRTDIKIYGGTASSRVAIDGFKDEGFPYEKFTTTSEDAAARLNEYWQSRGISAPTVVELNESGTEYGARSVFANRVRIQFPRDLSVLRRAYETDQQLSKSLSQQNAEAATVQLSKGEEPAGGDSVPPQAVSATAATQDLYLQTVARTIREGHYGLGSILATNILDSLFLRQYMAAHTPDMQFVLLEPDLLFLHLPEVNAFHGSIAISHYPMFSPPMPDPAFFPSSASEGIYRATLAMIHETNSKPDCGRDLWITIVGLDGYWPVAHLQNETASMIGVRVPSLYGAAFFVFVTALWAMAAAVFKGAMVQPGDAPRRWFADFTFDPYAPLSLARRYHAFGVVVALTMLILVLARPLQEVWGYWVYFAIVPAFCLAYATWPILETRGPTDNRYWWFDRLRTESDERMTPWMAAAVVLGGGVPIGLLYFRVWWPNANGWNYFAAYRSLFLGNGVNPTLPLVFAALSVASCAWYQFQRFICASERFVPLELPDDGDLYGPYRRVRDILSQYATAPAIVAAVIAMALLVGIARIHNGALSIEGRVYDWMFILVLAISTGLTMLSVCQFLQAWWHLSDFLRALAGLPMQKVFHDLPRDLGSVALFHSGIRQRTYLYVTRCRDLIHKMDFVPEAIVNRVDQAVSQLLRRAGADQRETASEGLATQVALTKVQALLLLRLEKVYWSKGQSELLPDSDKPAQRVLAEEFVALRFVGFIRYATIQLRNLLSFFSVSFILQAMAVSSYPFFAHSLAKMFILVAFVIMSSASGYVLWRMGKDSVLRSLATDDKGSDSPVLWQTLQTASLPLLTFAGTYFPELGRALFSWLIPALSSAK